MKKIAEYLELDGTKRYVFTDDTSVPTPVNQPTPVPVNQPTPTVITTLKLKTLKVEPLSTTDKKITWVIEGGSGSYGYDLGSFKGNGTTMFMPKNNKWSVVVFDHANPSSSITFIVESLDTNVTKVTNFNETGDSTTTESTETKTDTVTLPVVTPITPQIPTVQNNSFGKIGEVYTSKKRGKLILPSSNNSGGAQIFKVSRNGVEIMSYNRPAGWKGISSYWGNHPAEFQFAVEEGQLDFYFKNTHNKPVICGFTTGDQYSFYDLVGELEKTNIFKELEPNEEWSFSLWFKNDTQYEAIRRNWNNTRNTFFLTCPFYYNGEVCSDRVLQQNGVNGFSIDENLDSVQKFYMQSNPSVNTTIRFLTKSIYEEPIFEILEINGLYIKPDYTMLTCYSVTQGKVFCNDSNGYIWSKYYKTF